MGYGIRKVTARQLLAAATFTGLVAVLLVILAPSSESAQSMPPMMTPDELTQFGISQASDVTADPTVVSPGPRVTATEAVSIAAKRLHRATTNVRILHGSARPIVAQPERSVWIILFAGGDLPVLGPQTAVRTSIPVRYAGVEVDDQTGEVPTWFMH